MKNPKKGEFKVNFPKAIAQFEDAMQKFPVKKILYKKIFRGKGLEFDSYRVFEQDDDASMIDWKATLRANQTLAKKYIEERDLNVYFLVDVSNTMLFGSGDKLKAEYAAEFIVALAHLILTSGDKVGLVMFNNNVVKFVPPSAGKSQFASIRRFLTDSSLYGGGFDIDKAIDHALGMITGPYTIFILVSDFISVKKSSIRNLKLMGQRYETVSVRVRDPFDENLPKTSFQFSVQDPYSSRQMILDPKIAAERYRKNVEAQKNTFDDMLKHANIDEIDLITDANFVLPLAGFLRSRARGSRI